MLFCFPEEAARRPGYRAAFAHLFRSLPASTRLTVVAQCGTAADDVAALLAESHVSDRTHVVVAPEGMEFTVWAQDPFLVVGDRLVQPASFDHQGDDAVAPLVAAQTGRTAERSTLQFHGGNVLVGDDFALVSRDCGAAGFEELLGGGGRRVVFVGTDLPVPRETMRPLPDGRIEVVHRAVGRTAPMVHIDLFISLAGRGRSGRYRLLVGSPELADAVLGRPPVEHDLSRHFDDIAQQLFDEGFDVIRNPLPLTYGDGRRAVDGVVRDVRLWYFATANNCLVQIDEAEGDHVWMPTYGYGGWPELAATDEANRFIWDRLGFEVHEVPGFHVFAQRLGALHCITKYLER